MRQIVGQNCARCTERIPSVLDGGFCAACGCPVHNRCSVTTPPASESDGCKVCGAPAVKVSEHAAETERDSRERAARARSPDLSSFDLTPQEETFGDIAGTLRGLLLGFLMFFGGFLALARGLGGPESSKWLVLGGGGCLLGALRLVFIARRLLKL